MHADTEKTPGMVASLALILPGEYDRRRAHDRARGGDAYRSERAVRTDGAGRLGTRTAATRWSRSRTAPGSR